MVEYISRFCQDMLYGIFCFVCDKSNNVMEDTQIVQGRSVNRNDWRFCQDMSHGIFCFVCDKSHNVMEDTQIVQGRSSFSLTNHSFNQFTFSQVATKVQHMQVSIIVSDRISV
jgi:hypothetical protein